MIESVIGAESALEGDALKSLADREARWMLEASAVSAGRDPLFINQPELPTRVTAVYRSHIARRAKGEPLAYVLGESSFRGIDLFVTQDVLIPRPETEQLVDQVLQYIDPDSDARVLDQGTGSGAIAAALAIERPGLRICAVEISESALEIARRNFERHGLLDRVELVHGDLFPSRERRSDYGEGFEFIVANLPYIPAGDVLPGAVADWEPHGALYGGASGEDLIRGSLERSIDWITPGALLFYEIGETHLDSPELSVMENVVFRNDLAGKPRFMIQSPLSIDRKLAREKNG